MRSLHKLPEMNYAWEAMFMPPRVPSPKPLNEFILRRLRVKLREEFNIL
jgi:hypothetical protein